MRYKKRELLKLVDTLHKANRVMQNTAAKKRDDMENLLEDCQAAAIEIGTCLETAGEPVEPVVKMLEDYCESIYQLSLQGDDARRRAVLLQKVHKQLNQIGNAIRDGLPEEKREIVFLPYKAAMWDSLESIWRAAAKDDRCETFVIPVPWFEKKADGSLGEMHCEGMEYPDDVPVTDWREYKIEERRPDVIYIHNPYDEYNYVTTIHPSFYAKELRKWTEMLVYVPYFIGINNCVEEHFCIMPGVLYADLVIVESEPVRKIYLEALRRLEKENNCADVFGCLEEKILALGSPKLDRVREMKKEDGKLPEEWEKIING